MAPRGEPYTTHKTLWGVSLESTTPVKDPKQLPEGFRRDTGGTLCTSDRVEILDGPLPRTLSVDTFL